MPVAAAATWQRWPPCKYNTGKNVLFKNVDSVLRRTQRSLPTITPATLVVLAKDEDEYVRKTVLSSPNCPDHLKP